MGEDKIKNFLIRILYYTSGNQINNYQFWFRYLSVNQYFYDQ